MGSLSERHGGRVAVELILEDATFITMDPGQPIASALLVRDDHIAAVGDSDSVRGHSSTNPAEIYLRGRTVVPGLIDAHCHLSIIGYLLTGADCSYPSALDIPTIQARLKERAKETPRDAWVRGGGYVEYKLAERRHPTRWDLDDAVPDRPCVLYHTSYHACVLNSPALREVGYTDDSPDPVGGVLGRDKQERLNGIIFEAPMFQILRQDMRRSLGRMNQAERLEMADAATAHFASLGVTACADADLLRDPFRALTEADQQRRLNIRVMGLFDQEEFDWVLDEGLYPGGSDWVRVIGIKIFSDGGMSSRTAAIDGIYPVPPYGSGILFHEQNELVEMMRRYDTAGFQIGVHAQGDRAIRQVLAAYKELLQVAPGNPKRHRLEHGGAMYPHLLRMVAGLELVVVSQPAFLSVLGDGFLEAFGEQKGQLLYPFGSLRRAGVMLAGSSDAPVVTAEPLVGIRDSVLRRTASGKIIGQRERLTPLEAIEIYTRGGAFAIHREDDLGSLEVGKLADFVILDANPLEVSPEDISGIPVVATVVGGRVVHQREPILPRDLTSE
jgi:predicted amidohydrolase YtcJ